MMQNTTSSNEAYLRSWRGLRFLIRAVGGLISLIGVALLGGGVWLLTLRGSVYYLLVGGTYVFAGIQLCQLRPRGAWWVTGVFIFTVPWSFWESGTKFWAIFPRLMMPVALAAMAMLLTAPLLKREKRLVMQTAGVLALVLAVGLFLGAFGVHGAIRTIPLASLNVMKVDNVPSDWSAYGRTNAGTRYAPFDQINRGNVGQLKIAWQFHTGDTGPGVDQDTPLQIGDTLYTCSPNDHVAAINVDTGAVRWQHDPHTKGPFWQRCRGVSYYAMPGATHVSTPGVCAQRIINTTVDARLIALDAKSGQLCPDFGDQGEVDLKKDMGLVKPGFYFQTSAPLVARDYIVVGGFVADNQEVGEPSGVIRAFDARSGALVWAWDLGNPSITREPPAGQTYTRATPNMWTTAAYDDRLGLVYIPLGNETPDYFGGSRMKASDDYNSSIVALDVLTGRERWKVQTVHHDVWDDDLPSQPALMDLTDGSGGTVPALMQTTKRGQIFLVNRETGVALAEIAEKPVPQRGAVPGEKLSPTQPYSVGMPTIGAEKLSEKKMWGATMLDQLYCRIAFLQHNYDGEFTPIGLKPTLQQPGNAGGMNWGSVSYDPTSHVAFVNDIRIPNEHFLIPRADYLAWTKLHPVAPDGHGASAQEGLPYGEATYIWMSPMGVPCTEPPFGTITAIDLETKKIIWQVPAGTMERLGPFGITSHLPMPVGMPTYAGTMTTAGGLVFFAGFQDFYIRAYDAKSGQEVWKYPLPVGSSATPMSYISPKTNRQYIALAVGGAAHSSETADMVIAFSLPLQAP